MPQERIAAIFIALLAAIQVVALVLLLFSPAPTAQSETDRAVAGSSASANWPATWTPAPTPTPTAPVASDAPPTPTALPQACHVATPASLGKMRYALDCELTALWYLLQTQPAYRDAVSQQALYDALIYHDNPDKGFRGDLRGPRPGNSDRNYGLHARALADLGQRVGVPLVVIRSVDDMQRHLCRGDPVVVWMRTTAGRRAPLLVRRYQENDGTAYYTVSYEHAVLVTGYDAENVWYRDPLDGAQRALSWRQFEQEIQLFDKQMVAVAP